MRKNALDTVLLWLVFESAYRLSVRWSNYNVINEQFQADLVAVGKLYYQSLNWA